MNAVAKATRATAAQCERAALELAAAGFSILPLWWPRDDGSCGCGVLDCSSAGKHPVGPLVPRGSLSASNSTELVRRWWTRYPLANVGVVIPPSTVVVDIDPRNGGFDSWFPLADAATTNIRETVAAHTGGYGAHYWYALPAGMRIGANALGAGIDLKTNGFVVVPPSLHRSGRRYFWMPTRSLLDCPPRWLPEELASRCVRVSPPASTRPPAGPRAPSRYGQVALEREIAQLRQAGEGTRNTTLSRAAYHVGQLVAADLIEEDFAEQQLLEAAAAIGLL